MPINESGWQDLVQVARGSFPNGHAQTQADTLIDLLAFMASTDQEDILKGQRGWKHVPPLIQIARSLMPDPLCETHRNAIDDSFGSLDFFARHNLSCACLLPPLCPRTIVARIRDYEAIALRAWRDYVKERRNLPRGDTEGGHPSILDTSDYVFLTWDLRESDHWASNDLWNRQQEHLKDLFYEMSARTRVATENAHELLVDRVFILRWDDRMADDPHLVEFLRSKLWVPHFLREVPNCDYRLYFVDENDLKEASQNDPQLIDEFCDVAFFAFDDKIRSLAASEARPEVLPKPPEGEYAVCQFSTRIKEPEMLMLFTAEGRAALGTAEGDAFIARKRESVKKTLTRLDLKKRTGEIREILGEGSPP